MNRRTRGMTLIELLVVLAIIGIMVLVGTLAWNSIINSTSLRTASQEVKGDMRLARFLAISKNTLVLYDMSYDAPTKSYEYAIYLENSPVGTANYGVVDSGDTLVKRVIHKEGRVQMDYPVSEGGTTINTSPLGATAASPWDFPANTLIFTPSGQVKYLSGGKLLDLNGTLFLTSLSKGTGASVVLLGASANVILYRYDFGANTWKKS